jgi:hypothetical protein
VETGDPPDGTPPFTARSKASAMHDWELRVDTPLRGAFEVRQGNKQRDAGHGIGHAGKLEPRRPGPRQRGAKQFCKVRPAPRDPEWDGTPVMLGNSRQVLVRRGHS